MFEGNDFFILCAEKYLLNEHEFIVAFLYYFLLQFSVINSLIFVCGNEHFLANINEIMLNEM
jgi:hypothetical protein